LSEHFQKTLHCEKDRRFQTPCQPSRRHVIPSGRPSVHYLIRPDDVPSLLDTKQTSIICPDDVSLRPNPLLCREGSIQLASIRTVQQHVRTPLSTRTVSDSFRVPIKGRSINRPDDVVSCPDSRLLKARITIQISQSGRLTAVVRTRVHQRRKLPIRLQPS
jgi:hypothetical protein